MARVVKQYCAVQKCKKVLTEYRMALMIGPRGYRKYAVCIPCAEKLEKAAKNKKVVVHASI